MNAIQLKITKKADVNEGYGAEAKFEFGGHSFFARGGDYPLVSIESNGEFFHLYKKDDGSVAAWRCVSVENDQYEHLDPSQIPQAAVEIVARRDEIISQLNRISPSELPEPTDNSQYYARM